MNDDNKDPNSKAAGAPNDADDNPWDEDDGGGRTLATDGPSFELPSNIPSPITVPPPAIPKAPGAPGVRPRSPTMMGFGPMGPPLPGAAPAAPAAPVRPIGVIAPALKPAGAPASSRAMPVAPRVGAPASPAMSARPATPRVGVGGAPPSAPLPLPSARGQAPVAAAPRAPAPPPAPIASSDPPPAAKVEEPWEDDDSNRDDGPTMAGAPLTPDTPLRDDVVNPRLGDDGLQRRPNSPLASMGYQPGGFVGNAPAPSARLDRGTHDDDGDIEPIGAAVSSEETTRAVSREELMGHQNAQVILGGDDDAHGDEATLAVAPGALAELGIDPGLAAAFAEREARGIGPPSSPAFPFPSQGGLGAAAHQSQQPQSQPQQPVPSWQGEAAPSYRNPPAQPMSGPMGMQPGYDPLLAQGQHSSPGMQTAPQQQGYPMHGGGPAPYAQHPNAAGQQMPPSAPGQQWMEAAPQVGGGFAKKFTPQVIMLIVVGAVCLSIFVIGIVLFATTNFQPRP